MASQATSLSSNFNFKLTENDIPGASLEGRSPSELNTAELRFWLKCRDDRAKGLKTKAELVKRYRVVSILLGYNSYLTLKFYHISYLLASY